MDLNSEGILFGNGENYGVGFKEEYRTSCKNLYNDYSS